MLRIARPGLLLAAVLSWVVCTTPSAFGASRIAVPPRVTGAIAFHAIDVDQGAAGLLETPCGTIMIDAGGRTPQSDAHLMAYLRAYFADRPKRIDALFLTHPHIDHDRALIKVVNAYDVGGYVYDGRTKGDGAGGYAAKVIALSASKGFRVRAIDDKLLAGRPEGYADAVVSPLSCEGTPVQVRVLGGGLTTQPAGWTSEAFKNPNDHSLVIRVDYGQSAFLFMGDLETDAQDLLLSRYRGTGLLDVDVWHVAHHGADNGATAALLQEMSPEVVVISSGDPTVRTQWTAWDHGHPRLTTLQRLQDAVSGARARMNVPAFPKQNVEPVRFSISRAI